MTIDATETLLNFVPTPEETQVVKEYINSGTSAAFGAPTQLVERGGRAPKDRCMYTGMNGVRESETEVYVGNHGSPCLYEDKYPFRQIADKKLRSVLPWNRYL